MKPTFFTSKLPSPLRPSVGTSLMEMIIFFALLITKFCMFIPCILLWLP
jgi:hypothetical protein